MKYTPFLQKEILLKMEGETAEFLNQTQAIE
jgi:hypothetical protein